MPKMETRTFMHLFCVKMLNNDLLRELPWGHYRKLLSEVQNKRGVNRGFPESRDFLRQRRYQRGSALWPKHALGMRSECDCKGKSPELSSSYSDCGYYM